MTNFYSNLFDSQVLDLNEKDQTLTSLIRYRLYWKDQFLVWNPKDFNGIENCNYFYCVIEVCFNRPNNCCVSSLNNIWSKHDWADIAAFIMCEAKCFLTNSTALIVWSNLVWLPTSNIWIPDIVCYEETGSRDYTPRLPYLVVRNDGTVRYLEPTEYKTTCHVNISHFPFDEQVRKVLQALVGAVTMKRRKRHVQNRFSYFVVLNFKLF